MFQKVLKIILLSLVVSLIPSNFQAANSTEILWNPPMMRYSHDGGGYSNEAAIRNTDLLVYKSNPDELIMKIIMSESFEDKPFTGKGRNMGMWIYWPEDNCWSKNTANCEGLYNVTAPLNPSVYPSAKSSEYVFIEQHDKASNVNAKASPCKAPWWIDSTFQSRDTWAFAISITCLGIPKKFGRYAFSKIDLGQEDAGTNFTPNQTVTNPFHELAVIAAAENKEICVTGSDKSSNWTERQCTEGNKWVFEFCNSLPKGDLQILRKKKWVNLKSIKGIKNPDECADDEKYSGRYFYKIDGTSLVKHRFKIHGNSKYETGYLNLDIARKNPT